MAHLEEGAVRSVLSATLSGIDEDTTEYFCGMIMDSGGVGGLLCAASWNLGMLLTTF